MNAVQLRSYFSARDLDAKAPACERQSDSAVRFTGQRQEQFHNAVGASRKSWLTRVTRAQEGDVGPFSRDSLTNEYGGRESMSVSRPDMLQRPGAFARMQLEGFRGRESMSVSQGDVLQRPGAFARAQLEGFRGRGRPPLPLAPVAPVGTGFGRYVPPYADVTTSDLVLMWQFVPVAGGLRVAVPFYEGGRPVPWAVASARAAAVAREPVTSGYVLVGDTYVPAQLPPGRRHMLASTAGGFY